MKSQAGRSEFLLIGGKDEQFNCEPAERTGEPDKTETAKRGGDEKLEIHERKSTDHLMRNEKLPSLR